MADLIETDSNGYVKDSSPIVPSYAVIAPPMSDASVTDTSPTPLQAYSPNNRPTPQVVSQYAVEHNITPKEALRILCGIVDCRPGWCRATIRIANRLTKQIINSMPDITDADETDRDVILSQLFQQGKEGDVHAAKAYLDATIDEIVHDKPDNELILQVKRAIGLIIQERALLYCDVCRSVYTQERQAELDELARSYVK